MNDLHHLSAISLFVADVQKAKGFYSAVFGAEVIYEDEESAALNFNGIFINLLHDSAAVELVAPELVATAFHGVRMQLSIWVDDLEVGLAHLTEQRVEIISGPMDRPWGRRTVTISDPDGHNWEISQAIEP